MMDLFGVVLNHGSGSKVCIFLYNVSALEYAMTLQSTSSFDVNSSHLFPVSLFVSSCRSKMDPKTTLVPGLRVIWTQ